MASVLKGLLVIEPFRVFGAARPAGTPGVMIIISYIAQINKYYGWKVDSFMYFIVFDIFSFGVRLQFVGI